MRTRALLVMLLTSLPAATAYGQACGGVSLFVGNAGFVSGTCGPAIGPAWGNPCWGGGWAGRRVWAGPGWCGPGWGNAGWANPCWGSGWAGGGVWVGNAGWGFPVYTGFRGGWWGGGWGPPPVVIPAETLYGPMAMRRFMGLDPPLVSPVIATPSPLYVMPQSLLAQPVAWQPQVVAPQVMPQFVAPQVAAGVPAIAAPGAPPAALAPLQPLADAAVAGRPRPNVRASNADARGRAWTYVGYGDGRFQTQRFSEALARYRSAATAAPDLYQPHLRQAVTRFALAQYDQALESLRWALEVAPDDAPLDLSLQRLYGRNQVALESHLERLAEQAELQQQNGDLLMLLGAVLLFNEESERATVFLERAQGLNPGERFHVDRLLAAARQ